MFGLFIVPPTYNRSRREQSQANRMPVCLANLGKFLRIDPSRKPRNSRRSSLKLLETEYQRKGEVAHAD